MLGRFVARVLVLSGAALCSVGAGASLVRATGNLSGPAESPVNASPGIGSVFIEIDTVVNTLHVQATFSGLVGTTTNSHIHCCTTTPLSGTAGVATTTPSFAGFPLGVTAGSFEQTYNLTLASSWNPAFLTANGGTTAGAEATLIAGILAGDAYFNIHTTVYPGGEIRSFLQVPQVVSEPGTVALLVLALGALAVPALRKRR